MGLGDMDLLDDGDESGGKEVVTEVSCSICLEAVSDDGGRSWAKLQCGHQFHLDCIGSAFNSKGAMQCPNCRNNEKGQWLYANGSRPLPEFSMDEWAHDEDLYDLSYSEMSFGVHWCPFSGLARVPSAFEEDLSSGAYDVVGHHHAVFAEHAPVTSTSHGCPYIAYIGPIHPSSSSSSASSISDGLSSYNNHHHWSTSEPVPNSYGFPSMDVPPPYWEHSSSSQQPPIVPHQRTSRNTADNMPRPGPGMHPYIFGHSSGGRGPSSVTSSVIPPYPGTVSRPGRSSLQAYFQQSNASNPRTPPVITTSARRSSRVPPMATSSTGDQSSGFYFFSSSTSSGRAYPQEADRFHAWEREQQHQQQQQQPPFPLSQVDRDSSIWGPFHPPGGNGSENIFRSSNGNFRQRQNRS